MPVPPLASQRGVIRTDAYKAFDPTGTDREIEPWNVSVEY